MDTSKHVERFKLRRTAQGYVVIPVNPTTVGPLLLALFHEDTAALSRPLTPAKESLVWAVGELMTRARHLGLQLEPKGRLADPTLHLSRVPPTPAEEGVLRPFAELPGVYAGHWGLSDLYPEHQAALESALASGRAFDTGEFGAKKEIYFARVRRAAPGAPLEVAVRCEADDGVALADTAFWRAAGGNSACDSGEDALRRAGVPEENIEAELEQLSCLAHVGEVNEARRRRVLDGSVSLEQLYGVFDELTAECETELEARSQHMEALARARLAELVAAS